METTKKVEAKLTWLNFFQAAEMAAGTDRRIRYKNGTWVTISVSQQGDVLLNTNSSSFNISVEQMKEKEWSVEPEKSKEVFVWAATDKTGETWIFSDEPHKNETGKWAANASAFEVYIGNRLTDTEKPAKLRLVPADQPLIPWKKFVPEEMPNECLKVVVFLENQMELRGMRVDEWKGDTFYFANHRVVSHYCLRSEFPKNIFPEDE